MVYFGAADQFPGVDQLNLRIANATTLQGLVKIRIRTEGIDANSVDLMFTM